MKKISFLVLLLVLFNSCSNFQKVLNKGSVSEQYKMAEKLYKEKKYAKSLILFEKVTPKFRGKPQMQRIQYMVAKANYETKNYETAAYYFNRFISNYPESSKIEEADFYATQSYYHKSPRYSLDQKDTRKAMEMLQNFLDKYPNSELNKKINEQYKELSQKLDKKYFEIAKQHYTIENYNAAIVALDNYLGDFIGTRYKEDALFYKFKAAYKLALKSVDYKKKERIRNAQKYFERFNRLYPKSKYIDEAKTNLKKLEQELNKMQIVN